MLPGLSGIIQSSFPSWGVALEPDCQSWDPRQCLKLWILLPQNTAEAKSVWLMGFGGGKKKKRIRNLIWITRISRINSKLNESFTGDVNPCISGYKPILGFREEIPLAVAALGIFPCLRGLCSDRCGCCVLLTRSQLKHLSLQVFPSIGRLREGCGRAEPARRQQHHPVSEAVPELIAPGVKQL